MSARCGSNTRTASGGGHVGIAQQAQTEFEVERLRKRLFLEKAGADDLIVCGVGANTLFSLQAKYVPTNGPSASRLLDVSAWAGATNELFFGLMGGTSTNCTLQVENIRFFSLQAPQLQIAGAAGGGVVLSWTATAGGYGVETTTSLTSTNWTPITNAPVLTPSSYVLTNSWSDQTRFFRLRQR